MYQDWNNTVFFIPQDKDYIYEYNPTGKKMDKDVLRSTTNELIGYSLLYDRNDYFYIYNDTQKRIATMQYVVNPDMDVNYVKYENGELANAKILDIYNDTRTNNCFVCTDDKIFYRNGDFVRYDISASLDRFEEMGVFGNKVDDVAIIEDTLYTLNKFDGTKYHSVISSFNIVSGESGYGITPFSSYSFKEEFDSIQEFRNSLTILSTDNIDTQTLNINRTVKDPVIDDEKVSENILFIKSDNTFNKLYFINTDEHTLNISTENEINTIHSNDEVDGIFQTTNGDVYTRGSISGVWKIDKDNLVLKGIDILSDQYVNYVDNGEYFLYSQQDKQLSGVYKQITVPDNLLVNQRDINIESDTIKKTESNANYNIKDNTVYSLDLNNETQTKYLINGKTDVQNIFENDIKTTNSSIYDKNNERIFNPLSTQLSDINIQNGSITDNTSDVYLYDEIKKDILFTKLGIISNNNKYIKKTHDGKYLIATKNGMYVLNGTYMESTEVSSDVNFIDLNDKTVDRYTGNNINKYYIATGNNILESEDYRKKFNDVLSCESATVKCFKNVNQYKYILGTVGGLMTTRYTYEISNDVYSESFTDIDSQIQEYYDERSEKHNDDYHNSDSVITQINEHVIPVEFPEIHDWTVLSSSENQTMISNDLVKTYRFNDVIQHISVLYSNDYTDGQISVLDFEPVYIEKQYYSGRTEMILEISTTNTYYIPHVNGCPECKYYS